MKARWLAATKGEEDRKELEFEVKNSIKLRRRLIEILKQDIQTCRTMELSKESYSKYSGSWSEFKADCTGYQRALTEVLELVNLEE